MFLGIRQGIPNRVGLSGDLRAQVIEALYSGGRRGFLLDFSDKTTLFQDDAESSPITAASQQIAVARDISGNDLHFRQTTAGARPLYGEESGIGYARGDGVDDFMETVATNSLLTNADGMMFFAVGRRYGDKQRRTLGGQYVPASNSRVWADNPEVDAEGLSARYSFTAQVPDSFLNDRIAVIADDESSNWYTTIGAWAGAGTAARLKINGGAFVNAPATTPSVSIVSVQAEVLGLGSAGRFSEMDVSLFGAVDRDQSSDAAILELVQQLLDARTPA